MRRADVNVDPGRHYRMSVRSDPLRECEVLTIKSTETRESDHHSEERTAYWTKQAPPEVQSNCIAHSNDSLENAFNKALITKYK